MHVFLVRLNNNPQKNTKANRQLKKKKKKNEQGQADNGTNSRSSSFHRDRVLAIHKNLTLHLIACYVGSTLDSFCIFVSLYFVSI